MILDEREKVPCHLIPHFLIHLKNPRSPGGVRVIWLCLENAFEITWQSHESGVRLRHLAGDRPIQAISLLFLPIESA